MLTPAQLEERRSWVGASDIAALLLLDPYRGPRDVWLEKVHGFVPEKQPPRQTDAKDIGSCFESGCLDLAEVRLGETVFRHDLLREIDGTKIRVTLDGWLAGDDGPNVPVEAKTAGIINPWGVDPDDWGADGTDHFPPKYIVQLHAQMMATGAKYGYLSAVIGGIGHRLYRCERVDEIVETITKVVADFWVCVENQTEPDGEPPRLDSLKRVRRQPETVVRVPREGLAPVIEWKEALAAEKLAKEAKEAGQAKSLSLLGNAEGALLELHAADLIPLAAALGVSPEDAGAYCKLTYFADKRGSRTLRLQKADDDFMLAACDAPLIDLKQLNLIGANDE